MNRDVIIMRETVTKLVPMLAERDIKVTQQGTNAFVQYHPRTAAPMRVNIPFIPDNASDKLLIAIQGFLDHEVAHLLFTDSKAVKAANAESKRLANMHNIIEDTFIERCMRKRFKGSDYNLNKVGEFFLGEFTAPAAKEAIAEGNTARLFGVLMVPVMRAWAGQRVFQEFMDDGDKWSMIEKFLKPIEGFKDDVAKVKSSWEALDLARSVDKALREAVEPPPMGGTCEGDDETTSGEKPDESAGKKEKPRAASEEDDEKDDEPKAEAAEPAPLLDAEESAALDDALEEGDYDDVLERKISEDAIEASRHADYLVFTKDWDRVAPHEVPYGFDGDAVKELDDKVRRMTGLMQKSLERMMAARSRVQWHPGMRSGRMHAASLHRLAAGDGRVFRKRQEHKSKEVAASLLVDCSGSMACGRIELAMTAAYAMTTVLERIGVSCESLGFTTLHQNTISYSDAEVIKEAERMLGRSYSRYEPLSVPLFKSWTERMTPDVCKRFAHMAGSGYELLRNNVDGECVEIAGRRLLQRPESRKVLIVLSDGEPAALGHMPQQVAHLKRTVKDLSDQGVDLIGIGIETSAVQRYYPKSIVLNDLNALPGQVMTELANYLAA